MPRLSIPGLARLVCALLPVLALLAAPPALAQTRAGGEIRPVTLQLKWKHQFQFAGYYAAVEKGYYRNAGFDVRIVEAGGGEDTIATVLSGNADYGVANSELVLRRAMGDPVVALATILQHSALALAVRGGAGLTVHDLDGKRVMVTPHDVELFAYLQREGMPANRVQRLPSSFNLGDLTEGKVDGFSVYTTDQVWELRRDKFTHTILSPRAAGIDFYGDTLFTSEALARRDPERVSAFRDASLAGWRYAMEHPEEVADLILAKYGKRHSREHLLFEAAEMQRLMQPQLIEIGHMNPGRWQHIADVYAELGMLPRGYSLDGFLFDPNPRNGFANTDLRVTAAIAAALLAILFAVWLYRQNRSLRRAVKSRAEGEQQMRQANEQLRERLQEIRAAQTRPGAPAAADKIDT